MSFAGLHKCLLPSILRTRHAPSPATIPWLFFSTKKAKFFTYLLFSFLSVFILNLEFVCFPNEGEIPRKFAQFLVSFE